MIKKFLFLLSALFFFASFVNGQNVGDALRYSNLDFSGTARFMGTGGALGPLGADLSVTGTNPAGIALFRRSEFTATPALFLANTDAQLTAVQEQTKDSRTVFNFHNIGVVMTSQPLVPKWKNVNFAITLNNIGNYNSRVSYSGLTDGSIAERWQELANDPNIGLDNFETDLAEAAGVIYDLDNDPTDFETDYEGSFGALLQKNQTIITKGSASELSFALAANYNEIVMIGLSVGIPIIYYEYESTYVEEDESAPNGGNIPFFESLEYTDSYTTTGGGINAKLGVIVRVNQAFRFGGAVHTPTAYSFEDEFETSLVNNYFADADESGDFIGGEANSTGLFEYKLRTPWRFFAGAGYILGRNGFISAEAELVNHNNSTFRYDGFDQDEDFVNGDINQFLKSTLNLRLGGEVVLDDFRVRLGVGSYPSAFVGDDTRGLTLSAGAGYRSQNVYVDLAYRRASREEIFFPYETREAVLQEVQANYGLNRILLTFGTKF